MILKQLRFVWALGALMLLSSCSETLNFGYVNRMPYAVTIIEHEKGNELPHTLKPLEYLEPATGPNRPFDLIGPTGLVLGHYKPSQIAKSSDALVSYIVIRENGLTIESATAALQGLPRR